MKIIFCTLHPAYWRCVARLQTWVRVAMYLRRLASTFFSGRLGSLSWHRGRDPLISLLNPPDLFSRRSTYLYTLSACSAGPSSAFCCSQQQSSRPQTFTRSSEVSPLPPSRQLLPSLADQRTFSLPPPSRQAGQRCNDQEGLPQDRQSQPPGQEQGPGSPAEVCGRFKRYARRLPPLPCRCALIADLCGLFGLGFSQPMRS